MKSTLQPCRLALLVHLGRTPEVLTPPRCGCCSLNFAAPHGPDMWVCGLVSFSLEITVCDCITHLAHAFRVC
jgi:hypothetical protein